MIVTGERVVTPARGFNPTWQRHVAAYAEADRLLGPGRVLDVGAGVGHSYHLLEPREIVGLDIDAAALAGQDRETVVADMRALPFPSRCFDSVLAVQAIEHVPDPERALDEFRRVLMFRGTAMLVTPNRLTFARPDEVIDPYHHVEYSADELRALCTRSFGTVHMLGLFGSARYLQLVAEEHRRMDRVLAGDPLRLRRLVPRRARQFLYDIALTAARRWEAPDAATIGPADFALRAEPLEAALDLIALCRRPRR